MEFHGCYGNVRKNDGPIIDISKILQRMKEQKKKTLMGGTPFARPES